MQASGNALENFKECAVLQKGVPKHQELFFYYLFFYLAVHILFRSTFFEWILCQLSVQNNVRVLFYLAFLQVLKWEHSDFIYE